MKVIIGTSGWQYDDWRSCFYPRDLPKRRWLEYFSARFPTVEVNNTFYNLPRKETFVSWRQGSAEDFIITVKASRFITHLKRLTEPRQPVRLMWSRARRLGQKLGVILFQLPPNFKADVGRLESFLSTLPKVMVPAFEFRHPSWTSDRTLELLEARGAAYVLADRPGARVPDIVTGGWSYVRFHEGRPGRSDYERSKLRRWADRIAALPASEVYVYFNNDPGGAAIRDAVTLTQLLRERSDVTVRGPEKVGD